MTNCENKIRPGNQTGLCAFMAKAPFPGQSARKMFEDTEEILRFLICKGRVFGKGIRSDSVILKNICIETGKKNLQDIFIIPSRADEGFTLVTDCINDLNSDEIERIHWILHPGTKNCIDF